MDQQAIAGLITEHQQGFALERDFYRDPDIFEREVQQIFMRSWLYVGHQCLVPAVGDYYLFELAGESVIVIRSAADRIEALLNVCRHRGSRVCWDAAGHAKRFTCRYHGWTYDLGGQLRAASRMPGDFDKAAYPLKKVAVRVFQGLLFINFADDPVPFDVIEQDLGQALEPYGLERAKVAHRQTYPIVANWKLTVENYCECYHCAPSHPEYTLGHGRAMPREEVNELLTQVMAKAKDVGLTTDVIDRSWLDAGVVGIDRGFDRYPLLRGHLTGSQDGQPVAPLLGDIKGYDGGATDLHLGPVTFGLAYCDHVVLYRFTPRGLDATDCEITWLVNEDAEESRDYALHQLTWLWDVTTIEDKSIIEHNQAGVNSRFYEPGLYSEMEDFTQRFVDWYLDALK
jgi:Rieske 2Fe-2S family protein